MRITLDGDGFDLTHGLVLARLQDQVPEAIHDYWVEVDGTRWPVKQVISLATGVRERRRFQSQSARRWLVNLGFAIGSGQQVTARTARSVRPGPGADKPARRAELPQRDLVLVGCVKTKQGSGAPAKDLYTSDYFHKMRTYAETTGCRGSSCPLSTVWSAQTRGLNRTNGICRTPRPTIVALGDSRSLRSWRRRWVPSSASASASLSMSMLARSMWNPWRTLSDSTALR